MAKYGYARCSSLSQSTDIQVAALEEAGCEIVRAEKKSGRSTEGRTELATLIEFLREGDVLCVHCPSSYKVGRQSDLSTRGSGSFV